MERNQSLLASIAAAGHEIGNHSYHHEPWLHRYSKQQIEAEIGRAETQIEQATGGKPVGFRGPGFSVSHATLEVLTRRGYLYDASTLPTFLGPLGRAYYFMTARLSPEQRIERGALFGGFADGIAVEDSYVRLPQSPGIGFEQKAGLYAVMQSLLE